MKTVVLFAILGAWLMAGTVPAGAGKPSNQILFAATAPSGNPSLVACGLRTAYGRIVAYSPSNVQHASADTATENGCVTYSFTSSESGTYTAQIYELNAPGKQPKIVATRDFEVS